MQLNRSPGTSLPRHFPALAVLGLIEPDSGDWGYLRGLQYGSVARRIGVRMIGNLACMALVGMSLIGVVDPLTFAVWALTMVSVLIYGARHDRSLSDADRRGLDRFEMVHQAIPAGLMALLWAVALCGFAPQGGPQVQLQVWSIVAIVLVGTAAVYAIVPLGTVLFSAILGAAGMIGFAINGMGMAAVIAGAFAVVVCVGILQSARVILAGKVAEAGLAEKSEVVSLLLREHQEGDADWLWQVDAGRRVRTASPRFAYALGEDVNDIEGKPLIQLIAGDSWESGHFHSSLHDLAERMKRRESFSGLLVRVNLRGQVRWWELAASPILDDSGAFTGFRGVGSDVTEQRESSEKIAFLAHYDTLTGLPNRALLTHTLGESMRGIEQRRNHCAFLMIDLDRFKAVNDTLGHQVGDRLLARVSERLKTLMTRNELCGRLGGDEFAIVIRDGADADRVEQVAQAVIASLSQPYQVDNHELYVGASVGSAIGPRDGSTVETLMRNADLALYRAKDEGGSAHCTYEPALHAHAEERRRLEFSLRHAIERGEMSLVFQPVVDAASEVVLGFEALLRWDSADHGTVSPVKFIPVAEETRLIVPIGEWVLRNACQEAANWPSHVKLAINVSGEQLLDSHFAETVVHALAQSGLAPHRLEIEVTESVFVRDGTTAQHTLNQIMALGCAVALDDFGTGYSSLGYLRTMRFSTIKIDRSFVQGAARGTAESLAIVRAVVAMAESLEMATTAEGVETVEEFAAVRRLGCRKVQGYLFGRPMLATEARRVMQMTDAPRGRVA
ncbi:putative bifunctional diguanylate cyclase/phosphodiesterase [Novosphingobium sp.]|uniref:putative bifunctional diguanylate cyclase/phosphodiesterase n=1 Tax=Novosphingobium sp. TaxID=1874826 RepID=UPI0038BB8683